MLSQQSKTSTLKLLNRLQQMTSTSSFVLSFTLFSFFSVPFGLRCLTTMKQCLAGRIRQEQDRDRKERKEKRKKKEKE